MKKNIFIFTTFAFLSIGILSCEDSDQIDTINKTAAIEGSQEVPAVTTAGSGTVEYTYNKSNRQLTYKAVWTNLTDSAISMHIHGQATRGQNAGIFQSFTLSTIQKRKEGTYTGTLFVDNNAIKEADLLAGKYYLNIHSKAYPGGELRAQLEF